MENNNSSNLIYPASTLKPQEGCILFRPYIILVGDAFSLALQSLPFERGSSFFKGMLNLKKHLWGLGRTAAPGDHRKTCRDHTSVCRQKSAPTNSTLVGRTGAIKGLLNLHWWQDSRQLSVLEGDKIDSRCPQ